MKKIFKYFGFIVFFLMSFVYNEKAVQVIKSYDNLMQEIEDIKNNYTLEPIEAIVNNDSIIPGINGRKLNVEKTYYEMKKIGYINEKFLVYDKITIKEPLSKNIDKYVISGNIMKNNVSIIILLDKYDKKFNLKDLSYFGSGEWYERYEQKLDGITGYKGNYSNISWLAYAIKENNDRYFCMYKNEESKKKCQENNLYTIKDEIITNNYLLKTKTELKNGKIFIFKNSKELEEEIELIYKYITNKGYEIKKIDTMLKE